MTPLQIGASDWHPTTLAYFQNIQAAGGAPTTQWMSIIDLTIRDLIAAGILQQLDGLYFMAAPDAATAGQNVAQAGFDLVNNGCSFTANLGYTGAASSYVSTGYTLSTSGGQLTQNNAALLTWIDFDPGSGNLINGGFKSPSGIRTYVGPGVSGVVTSTINTVTSLTIANAARTGLFLTSRYGASAVDCWANGILIGDQLASPSAALSAAAVNACGVDSTTSNLGTTGLFGFGASLSQIQSSFLYEILHRFMQQVAGVA